MRLTLKLLISIVLVTVCIVVLMTGFFWNSQKHIIMQQAHIQAKTLFDMIVITRQWVAENRDEVKPVPAVVTKELSLYTQKMSDFRFHITSEQLINPDNAPDGFELASLKKFRLGANEAQSIEKIDNKRYYRYMAPLYVNEACMECHEYQGYKVGDLRGGISVSIPLAQIEHTMKLNNKSFIFTGAFAFLGIVLTVTLLLRMLVLKNISRLTLAAEAYKHGDFTHRVDINTGDEIQELSEAFNMMRASIMENEERLKSELASVRGSYQAVLEELRGRNQELKSINSFKTDILDNLAHEVRTPLTKIISYSELMHEKGAECGEEVRAKSLETIAKSAKLLNMLFNEIITLSRLDSDQYPYHFIPVNVLLLTESIISEYEKEIADKDLHVDIEMGEDPRLCLDGESFRHVIANLVSNAVKFSKSGGHIGISLTEDDIYKVFTVRDDGVGIPADELDRITKRFYRCSNVKREYSGTGLGLSIVYRIVAGHKGRLEVSSQQGEGSVFKVYIPKGLSCSTGLDSESE